MKTQERLRVCIIFHPQKRELANYHEKQEFPFYDTV